MKIDALPGLAALDEGRWNALLDRSRLPVALPHLAVADRVEPRLRGGPSPADPGRVTDADGSLAGVLPLYEDGPERQRIIGGVDVSDYLDLIAAAGREEEVWQALLQHRAGQPGSSGTSTASARPRPPPTVLPALAPALGLRATVRAAGPLPGAGAAQDLGRVPGAGSPARTATSSGARCARLERELPGVDRALARRTRRAGTRP